MLIPIYALVNTYFLPQQYQIGFVGDITYRSKITNYITLVCPIIGLVAGCLIGIITEFYTSMDCKPVKHLVKGCKQGPGINIILGLASNFIPSLLICIVIFFSFKIAGMFGISLAALGMLGNLCIGLAIDGFGPISDNAGGLATMSRLDERIRVITDQLDACGNTTAAIGKGFAIGSACLVSFALFGAFVTRTKLRDVDLMTPIIFSGLIFGAMIPYLFSALVMKAVGTAAEEMVDKVRELTEKYKDELLDENFYIPDTHECISVATVSSLRQMILPGLIVILTPIIIGILFGPKCVAGLLIGIIISGIQMAISSANTGGAWDNTKKSIKTKGIPVKKIEELKIIIAQLLHLRDVKNQEINELELSAYEELLEKLEKVEDSNTIFVKKWKGVNLKGYRKAEKSSIIGDTVGDPLKDTSGPSLNILVKLSSIISVIFGTLFVKTGYIIN